MKKQFFDILFEFMKTNKNIYILFGGLGYPRVDEFIKAYPDRAINCEASEQTMLDISVGLAYDHKIPIVYTITPFLYRGLETIRTYLNHENLHVIMVGAGRDGDYSDHGDGFSHDAKDVKEIFKPFKNLLCYFPEKETLEKILTRAIADDRPSFISIRR